MSPKLERDFRRSLISHFDDEYGFEDEDLYDISDDIYSSMLSVRSSLPWLNKPLDKNEQREIEIIKQSVYQYVKNLGLDSLSPEEILSDYL